MRWLKTLLAVGYFGTCGGAETCEGSLPSYDSDVVFLVDATETARESSLILDQLFDVTNDYTLARLLSQQKLRLGLVSYRDQPEVSGPSTKSDGRQLQQASQYCSKLHAPFLSPSAQTFRALLRSLQFVGGNIIKGGNALGALHDVLVSDRLQWKPEAKKSVFLFTSQVPKPCSPRLSASKILTPHIIGDTDLCLRPDYAPCAEEVADLLVKANVTLAVASINCPDCVAYWNDLKLTSTADIIVDEHFQAAALRSVLWDSSCGYNAEHKNLYTCLVESKLSFDTWRNDRLNYRLNRFFPVARPTYIVNALSAEDVSKAVWCANEMDVPVIARSGGHDYSSASYGFEGALVVRMTDMVQVEFEGDVAKVGVGMRLSTMNYKMYEYGDYFLPGGSCTTVGMGGHTLGGGYGYYTRAHGFMADRLIGAQIVLATGEIREVSLANATTSEDRDLMWALKGAGSGSEFGIVTRLDMKMLHPPKRNTAMTFATVRTLLRDVIRATREGLGPVAPPELGWGIIFDSMKTAVQAHWLGPATDPGLADSLRAFYGKLPPLSVVGFFRDTDFLTANVELTILDILDTNTPVAVPPVLANGPNQIPTDIVGAVTYANGRIDFGINLTDPLAQLDAMTIDWKSTGGKLSARKAMSVTATNIPPDFIPPFDYYKSHSFLWTKEQPLTDACIDAIVAYTAAPWPTFGFALEFWGGNNPGISGMGMTEEAFPHRDAEWIMHSYIKSRGPLTPLDEAYMQKFWETVRPCAADAVYSNFRDYDLGIDTKPNDPTGHAHEANQLYFRQNLPRLQKIKAYFDPKNRFWFPQAIHTA